jgi:hypothetical protein
MTVKIHKSYKVATQSGNANGKDWVLEFMQRDRRFQDQIMGWTGSTDMKATEVRLHFKDKDEAIKFAKDNKLEYFVSEPKKNECVIKTYTDNYK